MTSKIVENFFTNIDQIFEKKISGQLAYRIGAELLLTVFLVKIHHWIFFYRKIEAFPSEKIPLFIDIYCIIYCIYWAVRTVTCTEDWQSTVWDGYSEKCFIIITDNIKFYFMQKIFFSSVKKFVRYYKLIQNQQKKNRPLYSLCFWEKSW